MRERPDGLSLLQLAVSTLREQLLPKVSEEQRYAVLMVANAISIAGRQLRADERTLEHGCALLESVVWSDEPCPPLQRLVKLERKFALGVRAGAADTDPLWQQALWALTVERVRESAPRYLETEGID